MSEKKAVLFNFWGVVASSRPRVFYGLRVFAQMIPAFEAECAEEAGVRGVTLPSDWSARGLLEDLREAMMDVQPAVMKTAVRLRHSGLLTAVLANHWLDDVAAGGGPARLLSLLGAHFDLVLQSCRSGHRVPEPAMFRSALQQLGVTSQQALWMDADEEGVKAAEGVGMTAVLVEDLDEALKKLANFTGVQVRSTPPPPCSPDDVAHGYVTIRPGVRTHYVEMGSGPPVVLCHGFPESWYSWRYQIPAVAAAGFRVLALDMKGYGGSTAPPDIEEYSQQQLCKAIPQVTLVGHDWGGVLVWTMAQYFPERVRAAASLNTPLFPADPSVSPAEKLKAIPIFDYQLYFQKPGVAEAELEKDLERTFIIMFVSSAEVGSVPLSCLCVAGGLFVGLPEQIPRGCMLTEADLRYYVSQYRERGFRSQKMMSHGVNLLIIDRRRPLNWYRNGEENWRWMCSRPPGKMLMPALMVTAGKDQVLLPAFSKGMEDLIPHLSRGHIEDCGHWTQMERPAETNGILISWLQETLKGGGGVFMAPKL
uniref:AB hydrolase-1 domain-containing protein n=1 Tax=Gasterosteus aculeatus aculeatus TaxID=481459 RepID=A0AAQ4R2L2_GASAC